MPMWYVKAPETRHRALSTTCQGQGQPAVLYTVYDMGVHIVWLLLKRLLFMGYVVWYRRGASFQGPAFNPVCSSLSL